MKEHKKYELAHGIYTENELWEIISELSDIRAGYSIFDAEEHPKYRACRIAIDAIRTIMGVDKESD